MHAYIWQKSSYSTEGANCLNLATAPGGILCLRESDEPDRILTVNRAGLSALLATIKEPPGIN